MPGRDVVYDAALLDLVGKLAVRPVGDRSPRSLRLLTRQRHDLTDLVRTDARRRPWPGQIAKSFFDAEVGTWYWLQL